MYGALRPLLFRLDPERAHRLAVRGLEAGQAARVLPAPPKPDPRLLVKALGLAFPGPLGMAAGFDKEARVYGAPLGLGFSHVEVGTVTPRAQPGNDGRRMQRLPGLKAIVNRLGFPNPGMDEVAGRLRAHPAKGLVAANVGPNKSTPPEKVGEDVAAAARALGPLTAYVTVNVSSPNTPGLRSFQAPEQAARLVAATLEALDQAKAKRPVLLKLHPDAPDDDLVAVGRAAVDAGAAGLVATNTTRARPPGSEGAIEGGLSGAPLRPRALQAVAALHRALPDVPIVGVGGVATGDDLLAFVQAGASLTQAYTAFVYRGPRFPRLVHRELLAAMDRLGIDRLAEATGRKA